MKMMKGLFRRKKSCEIAKDRLKILLISDRVNCSPEMMELVKADIVNVISKYMKIDTANMDIQISKSKPALYANIPILDLKEQ